MVTGVYHGNCDTKGTPSWLLEVWSTIKAQENKFLIFRAVTGSTQYDTTVIKWSACVTHTHTDGAKGESK